jgi:hypothetical protein
MATQKLLPLPGGRDRLYLRQLWPDRFVVVVASTNREIVWIVVSLQY